MDSAALILLAFALVVVASAIVTAFRSPIRGNGGPTEPTGREKPSADEPTSRRAPPA